jgi:hypothetical protein
MDKFLPEGFLQEMSTALLAKVFLELWRWFAAEVTGKK